MITEVKLRQQLTERIAEDMQTEDEIVTQLMAQNANLLSILQDSSSLNAISSGLRSEEQPREDELQNKPQAVDADYDSLIKCVISLASLQVKGNQI